MKQILPAAAMALVVCAAQAQTYHDSGGTVVPAFVPITPNVGPLFTPSNPGNVAGAFSASLGGFTPTPSYKQLTSSLTSSVSAAVPTGTVDVVYNTSASVAYCTYGASGVAATSSSDVIQANSWVAFTVPSGATTIACISPSGTLAINISGGSGLPTGSGGGGGGGGGSVPTGTAGSPNASVLTVQGISGATGVPVSGTVGEFNFPATVATGTGASNSSTPRVATSSDSPGGASTNPSYANILTRGSSTGGAPGATNLFYAPDNSSLIALSTDSCTPAPCTTGSLLQAGISSESIRVFGYHFIVSGTTSISFGYSTSTSCTSVTVLDGPMTFSASVPGLGIPNGVGPMFTVPAGDTLCIVSTGSSVSVGGSIAWQQSP